MLQLVLEERSLSSLLTKRSDQKGQNHYCVFSPIYAATQIDGRLQELWWILRSRVAERIETPGGQKEEPPCARGSLGLRDRLSDGGEKFNDLHRLFFFVHPAFRFHLLSHLALGHIGIADLGNLAVLAHKHRIPTLVASSAVRVAAGVAGGLGDARGRADPARHLHGRVVLGIEQEQGSDDNREQHSVSFHAMYLQRRGREPNHCDVRHASGVVN